MADHTLRDLRRDLAQVERGRGKKYPDELRAKLIAWSRHQVSEGRSIRAVAAELAVHSETLRHWMIDAPAFLPVEVVTDPASSGRVSIVSPKGFRAEGLTLDEAAALLRAIG